MRKSKSQAHQPGVTLEVSVMYEPLSVRFFHGSAKLIVYLTDDPTPWSVHHIEWFSKQAFTTSQLKLMTIMRIWRRAKKLRVPAEVFDILISSFVSFHMLLPLALRVTMEKLAGGCLLAGAAPMNLESWQSNVLAVRLTQYLSTSSRLELLKASSDALFSISQGELSALFSLA